MNKHYLIGIVLALAGLLAACQPAAPTAGGSANPDDIVLSWHREGGIAGFCDDLTITAGGEVTATSCMGREGGMVASAQLDATQQAQLEQWVGTLGAFEVEQSDDAVADSMTVGLTFKGRGSGTPNAATEQALLDFAGMLYAALAQ